MRFITQQLPQEVSELADAMMFHMSKIYWHEGFFRDRVNSLTFSPSERATSNAGEDGELTGAYELNYRSPDYL